MLTDTFGRTINYLRISVTDRCDFRCVYCMAEEMTFVPRQQLLTLEELNTIAQAFVALGVSKIRITGGEPLIRRNIMGLFDHLGSLAGLNELTLTSNGSQLSRYAEPLAKAGVKRINVSLDSLRPERFKALTRTGELHPVLAGIDSALDAGLRVKLNSVILKHRNQDEVIDLIDFARAKKIDISFIEEMPLGAITEHQRQLEFVSSADIIEQIANKYSLTKASITDDAAGPSRYWQMDDSDTRVGFISPHSNNFCSTCNRVRLTAKGQLLLCLGNEDAVDLKAIVRRYPGQTEPLQTAIIQAMKVKPERHHFELEKEPQILRFMNTTGG